MSAVSVAVARPLRDLAPQPRRHLEVVPTRAQRRARPRMLPALVTIGGIGVILLAQLLLSIVVANGAYQISGLQSQKHDAVLQQHALAEQLDVLASPQHLAANAEALGMVASGNAVYLDAKTGAVTGSGTAAGGSLIGAGDQVGNVLLADSTTVAPASAGSGAATTTNSAGDSQTSTDAGTGGAGQDPQTPGLLPSPNTH